MAWEIPRHLSHPQQPAILGTLCTLGFDECLEFPRIVVGRTLKALGLGIMKHLAINYPPIKDMLNKTWKRDKIPHLSEFYSLCQNLEACYLDAVFWDRVKEEIFAEYVADFRRVESDPARPDALPRKAEDIRQRGDLDINSSNEMDHTARILMIYLFIFQKSEIGYVGQIYKPENKYGLVVVLVQENDVLYLMLHRGLKSPSGGAKIPYYLAGIDAAMKFKEEVIGTAPVSPIEDQRVEKDVVVQLETLLKEVVGSTLQVIRQLPPGQLEAFDRLKPVIESFQRFSSGDKRPFSFVPELTALRTVLESPQPVGKEGQHCPHLCTAYYLSEPFTTLPCGNRIHTACLQYHLNCKVEEAKQTHNLEITCPVCETLPIPDDVIDQVNHEAFEQLSILRKPMVQEEAYIEGPETPTRVRCRCQVCNGWWDSSYQYQHPNKTCPCEVTIFCLRGLEQCSICRRPLDAEEIMSIAQYFSILQS